MKHPKNDLRHFGQIATVIVYGALVAASYALEMPLVKRSFEIFITNIGFLAGILRRGIWGVKSSLFPWDHQGGESGTVHHAAVDSKSLVGARISPTSRPLLEPAAPE